MPLEIWDTILTAEAEAKEVDGKVVTHPLQHELVVAATQGLPIELTIKFAEVGTYTSVTLRVGTYSHCEEGGEAWTTQANEQLDRILAFLRAREADINKVRASVGHMTAWSLDPKPAEQLPPLALPFNTLG